MILQTIKLKCDNELGYRIINLYEYNSFVDLVFEELNDEPIPAKTGKRRSKLQS